MIPVAKQTLELKDSVSYSILCVGNGLPQASADKIILCTRVQDFAFKFFI